MKTVRHGYFFWGSMGLLAVLGVNGCSGATGTTSVTGKRKNTAITSSGTATRSLNPSAVITAHNKWRAKVGVPGLKWSDILAKRSKSWAKTLAGRCIMKHSHGEPYGENIFYAGPLTQTDPSGGKTNVSQQISSKDVVNTWGEEKKWYDYRSNSCHGGECGHYTQVIWKDTTEVGCAMALCKNNAQIWVCQYKEPGNLRGKRPY
ncbi:CAP domain-containing protein [Candidatus Electrothrix sp.]|uniref:CAP domain-containing protein n=1 Tax=Candidatus Electrothrix sp. TaxID=2170559 RepID=UPI0040565463